MKRSADDGERRVLVVEDSLLIAMDMESLVGDCGCRVVGPVADVASGLEVARQHELDGALLDINLGDERVWPVAELLDQQGVPFVLTTGYSSSEIPPRFGDREVLQKPVALEDLQRALGLIGVLPN
ncbi:response regulator [Roseibium salinum]|uniref:Response regulator n=1 Tax=Roseibium salinum TaxID=1604349 RepID=A0ABT3QW82_9HYPH|nr:response regulator [Roseibium sp. DSM 29163]MCX2721189.1 response regulator [Roseibium sp. DSM 29163]MDN3722667.1 response regulator [Roseibium salinum]